LADEYNGVVSCPFSLLRHFFEQAGHLWIRQVKMEIWQDVHTRMARRLDMVQYHIGIIIEFLWLEIDIKSL